MQWIVAIARNTSIYTRIGTINQSEIRMMYIQDTILYLFATYSTTVVFPEDVGPCNKIGALLT